MAKYKFRENFISRIEPIKTTFKLMLLVKVIFTDIYTIKGYKESFTFFENNLYLARNRYLIQKQTKILETKTNNLLFTCFHLEFYFTTNINLS